MENYILLSICIPTFNRANYLESSLSAIMQQLTEDNPIEIVVSDNCSNDKTQEIIKKYSVYPKFRSYKQDKNIGAIENVLKLVKEYARGKFCWIIGDDDYIINGGIKSIISILQMHSQTDFIFVKLESFKSNEVIYKYAITEKVNIEIIQSFENLLQPKYSALFLGEIMGGIFRRKLWLKYDKIYKHIDSEHLSTLEMTYPHCVIYANQFMGKKAIYVSTPIVIVDDRAREWWDKSNYIIIEHLYTLIQLFKSKGLSRKLLKICNFHYMKMTFPIFIKFLFNSEKPYRERISFKRYFLFLLVNPELTAKLACYFLAKKMKSFFVH